MVQHIEIVKQIIQNLVHTVKVKSVDNSSGTKSVLSVCNTYYLNACDKFITIAGIQYEITDFTLNSSLTLVPQDAGMTLVDPSTTEFDIPAPRFYSGTPKATSKEKTADESDGEELVQGSVIWILEVLDILPPEDINKSLVRSTMDGVNIFFLDDTRHEDWNTEDHRTNVINPQKNELEFVFKGLQKMEGTYFDELEKPRTREHADFGKYIIDKGYKGTILTERLSGVQAIMDIPFLFDPCDDCENGPVEVCKPVSIALNGVSFGLKKAGSVVDIPVLDDNDSPTGFQDTFGGESIWRIGGASRKVYYNRPALGGGISYADHDEHWLFANGVDDLVEIEGILQQTDETVSRDYLLYYNAFGHKFRFTGLTGGYYDFNDGQYKDVNGVLSTFNAEFSTPVGASGVDGYIIDHLTGLGYRSIRGGSGGIDWLDTLNVWGTSLFGFNDFMAFPSSWMQTLFNENVANATAQAERPPFQYDQSQFWTATGIEAYLITAAKVVTYLAQTVTIRNKTTAGINREFNRIHYTRSEFVVQP